MRRARRKAEPMSPRALTARYSRRIVDHAIMAMCYLGASLPTFTGALLLVEAAHATKPRE